MKIFKQAFLTDFLTILDNSIAVANNDVFTAFKLVYMFSFGPQTNIQVPVEVPKAFIVMSSKRYFQVESFLLLCYTIVGTRIAVIWIWLNLLPFPNVFKLVCMAILGTKIKIQGSKWLAKIVFVIQRYRNFQARSFYKIFWPFLTRELLLFEFYDANSEFFKGLKLVYLVIFGRKINVQVPKKSFKAIFVILRCINLQGGSFNQTFLPYLSKELLLFEFDRPNSQFFKGLKLVCLVILGPKINI